MIFLKLKQKFKQFIKEEEGMGTLEVVIIIAVLICLAFLLKGFVVDFFKSLTNDIKTDDKVKNLMGFAWQLLC